MSRPKAIHTMVDQVFVNGIEEMIDDIAEERTFIVNTLKLWINDDEMWQEFVDSKQNRKVFLNQVQALMLQELETNALIELATINNEVEG
jgi:putative Ca2+/H+ antiporter (TMEM165/GDT1 family)